MSSFFVKLPNPIGSGSGVVTSVNGAVGDVNLDAGDVGADPAGTAQTLFDTIGDKYVRSTRFQIIGSGTSGTVTLPLNSQVVLDDFGGTTDAVITTVQGGLPTLQAATTSGGVIVATSFSNVGGWVLTGTPSSYPIAIVYRVRQELKDFDSTSSNIWGNSNTDNAPVLSVNGRIGNVVPQVGDYNTAQVSESTNLYFTDERAQDAIGSILTDSSTIDMTYNDGANTISASVIQSAIDHGTISGLSDDDHPQYQTSARADTWLATKSTTNISEGTNLYFTDERVDDRVAALVVGGTGITSTYNDTNGTLTLATTITQYTNEDAQDAVGAALVDTASIDFTYNDAGNSITANVLPAGVNHDALQNYATNQHIDHTTVSISAGTGLTGGGNITTSRTLSIANSGVTAATYGSATQIPVITVNAQGQISTAINTSISIPSTQVSDFTEAAQDAVGSALTDTASIDFIYTDASNTITANVLPAGVNHNALQNYVTNQHTDHSTVNISAGTGLSGGGDITTSRSLSISNTGVTASTYGSATQTTTINVNAQGQLTSAASTTIAIPSTQITDFVEAAQDAVGNSLVDSATIDFTYNDVANTTTAIVVDTSITTAKLADLSVSTAKIIDNAVTASKILDSSVITSKILDGAITNIKVATGIDAAKLSSGVVSNTEFDTLNGVTSNLQTQLDGKQPNGAYITALTGDATASGPGSAALTLANTTVVAGVYNQPQFTVDSKGRITAAETRLFSINTSAAQATTSNTFTIVGGMTTANIPVGVYKITVLGLFQSAATGTGIGFRVVQTTATITTIAINWKIEQAASGTDHNFEYKQKNQATNVTSASVVTANSNMAFSGVGILRVTSIGNISLQYRSETNGTSVTVQPDTFMILERI